LDVEERLQMKVKTGFYFIGWLMKRFFKTLFSLPMSLHRKYMETYQDNRWMGLFAWLITSSIGIFIAGVIGLVVGDTDAESISNFKTVYVIGYIVAVIYFITCVILDQYEKFETERMATWHTLKD
jgi:undecaprenyl pyrophosphate phosphatase UppP